MSEISNSTHGTNFNMSPDIDVKRYNKVFEQHDIDQKGFLNFYELKFALADVGVNFSHPYIYYKLIQELQKTTKGKISFFHFVKLATQKNKDSDDSSDILDAFVAMGGNEDETGCIDAEKLIGTIKND